MPVLLAITTVSRGEEEQRRHPADQGGHSFCNIPHAQMSGLPSDVSRRLNTSRLQTPVNLRSPARISVLSHLQEIICRIEWLPGILAGWRFLLEAVLRLGSQIGAGGSVASVALGQLRGDTEHTGGFNGHLGSPAGGHS